MTLESTRIVWVWCSSLRTEGTSNDGTSIDDHPSAIHSYVALASLVSRHTMMSTGGRVSSVCAHSTR